MKSTSWISKRRGGLAVGVVTTVIGCGLYAGGLLDGLVAVGLDLHFRHLSTIEADPRIVLVDIDDSSIEAVGDWPWPRRRHAQLVNTLKELGADRIVLDMVFAEPTAPRRGGLGRHYDVDTTLTELGDRDSDAYIRDDDELRDAMASAGNVYLAMFGALTPPDVDPDELIERALAVVRQDPQITFERFRAATEGATPGDWSSERFYQQSRIVTLLQGDFGLDESALIERLGLDNHTTANVQQALRENLAAAKQLAGRRAARSYLDRNPAGTWLEFLRNMLPDRPVDALSPDRECLLAAFRQADAIRAVGEKTVSASARIVGCVPHAFDLTLPVEKLTRAATGVGFVAFAREESGGVVRAVPLAVTSRGMLLPQLGLVVAMDVLGLDRPDVAVRGNTLIFGNDETRRVQLDEHGLSLVNWHVPRADVDWRGSFTHIPAARLLQISANRTSVSDNERRLGIALGELVEVRHAETPAEYGRYARLINERRLLRRRVKSEPSEEPETDLARRLGEVERTIEDIEREATVWLTHVWGLWENEIPRNDNERAQRERVLELYGRFGAGQYARRIADLNSELGDRTNRLLGELRPRIEGKICLVGYTASGAAELVTSPIHAAVPGVMVHANVINTLLQDQPVTAVLRLANLVLLLIGGLIVTVTSCARGWRFSIGSMIAFAVAIAATGAILFWGATVYFASSAVVILVGIVWAAVTAYRQSTEERARRHLQRALTQYTAPAVAAHIVARVGAGDLAPSRAEVTCFFSDLRGFTSISERLGPERTRLILNPFFGEMSRVLVERGAIVNKFMGDGIFAFFNAPIHPCPEHAYAGCGSALVSLEALIELNRLGEASHGVRHDSLVMRIGMSTGETFVGDYGSDTKLDYTCIGDTVNVASRLEAANKVLGTAVLVDEATRQQAGSSFEFRHLGLLDLPGKKITVSAYELVGRSDGVDDATRDYISLFERLVRHYQVCEWDSCLPILAQCRKLRPDDRAVAIYEQAIASARRVTTSPDWNRAIPITSA